MTRYFLILLLWAGLWGPSTLSGQEQLGEWQDHLPYREGIAVTEGRTHYYCATRHAVFSYNKQEKTTERLTKLNALSDLGISTIRFNWPTNTLVVGYENGNVDLLRNQTSFNLSAIKDSDILGNKGIHHILFDEELAYLACGFGIVVLDLEDQEVKDTYLIGNNSSEVQVNALAFFNDSLMAATEQGVYKAPMNSPNLADFNEWGIKQDVPYPNYAYQDMVVHNDRLMLLHETDEHQLDSLWVMEGPGWNTHPANEEDINDIEVVNSLLIVTYQYTTKSFNKQNQLVESMWTYIQGGANPNSATMTTEGDFLIADRIHGMIAGFDPYHTEKALPEGPYTSSIHNMAIDDGNVWVATGSVEGTKWENSYLRDGVFHYQEGAWSKIHRSEDPAMDTIFDIINIAIDPSSPGHVFAGTWGSGLLEIDNGELTAIHDHNSGSSLQNWKDRNNWCGIGGLAYDDDNNLWISNSYVESPVSVLKPDGTWRSYDFGNTLNASTFTGELIVTGQDQKWMVLPRGTGLFVWEDQGTLDDPSDDQYKILTTAQGQGGLPSNEVHAIAEDLDGEIWVGTAKGIAVFYTPTDIFSSNPSDAEQILLEQDGLTEVLLETEVVTSIAVDGGDRKWIGTESAGVFLMSANGTELIEHFNASNSPLFSNTIKDIAIDHENGLVYIGTSEGLLSYKGAATEGKDVMDDITVYPNPVTTDYQGPISITGLPRDSDVKVTDVSGNVVYRTRSLGGKATWNGKDFSGLRVKTGVYLVFCSSPEGEQNQVAKILFVN